MFSAEKLLSLIDALGGIVWEAHPETFQFSFVSAEAERILGYPVKMWLVEPDFWRRHTHPDDVARCAAYCLDASRRGLDHQFDYRMIGADGRVVWLRDIVSVITSPDGTKRLVGIALDITAEKEEEGDKHRLSRVYEALIENSSDNISLLRVDGTPVYQSAAIRRQLGYEPDEVVGRNNFDLIHPDDLEMAREGLGAILQTDDAIGPFRYRFRHKDGRWCVLESVGKRFTAEDGTVFIVVNTRDMTEVVNVQRALEATQEQLAQAMKMEAVGRLAGGVAHDFNNLLTVIAGYAELVSGTLDSADLRADDLGEIKRAAHRASLLTRQLLAFSRKQVLKPEILNLTVVVQEVGVLIRRLIGEDIQLVLETTPASLPVLADRSQLEQVLMNLAVNARDAMPVGGRLIIRTATGDQMVYLIVSDTGTGMPEHVLGRIFEPFFTTKEVGKGTGLGLSTAWGIIKQSHGNITVRSEVDKGTTFTISLPMARAADERASPVEEEMPRGVETILLVEDDEQVRELIEQVLLRLGYDVLTAADGAGAIDICKRHRRGISLLITDVVMAHTSGPQVYARVAAMIPGIAVLYISGYTGDTVLARGIREEGVAFLQKPFTPVALAQRVREVLDDAGREQRSGEVLNAKAEGRPKGTKKK
jgi:two-component system, cell cycle sensor histidine kinase and response regulator CckA